MRTHTHRDVFQARLPWQEMVKLNKGSIFVITETQFAIQSGYVTTKLHGTSTCRCNNNAIFSDRAIFKFPAVYLCLPCKSGRSVAFGSSCQTGKMAALLNSLFFVFKISFLPKYRVI